MTRQTHTGSSPLQELRRVALSYPETEEGIVCTRSAFKARNKAFVFMGSDEKTYNVMLKLRGSLAEAATLAAKMPEHFAVGGHDWVTVTLDLNESPPPGLLERWIDESFRLLIPKSLVALLPGGSTEAAKKKVPKQKSATRKVNSRRARQVE